MFNIQERIDTAVRSEDRVVTHWHASRLGQCLKGAYLERLGAKPDSPFDARTLRVFEAGRQFEDFIVKCATKDLPQEEWETQTEMLLPEYDAIGHVDLNLKKEKIIYEIKTVHSTKFWYMQKSNIVDEHYQMQLMFYLLASGYPEGRLLYVSKDDLTLAEYIIKADNEKIRSAVIRDLTALNEAWKTKVAPQPQPAIVDGKVNWKAKYCKFHCQCLGNSNWLEEAQKLTKSK